MDKKIILIIMEIVLILILLLFCLVIEIRESNFKRDCKINYDINDSCPCIQTRYNINLSIFNKSNNQVYINR